MHSTLSYIPYNLLRAFMIGVFSIIISSQSYDLSIVDLSTKIKPIPISTKKGEKNVTTKISFRKINGRT